MSLEQFRGLLEAVALPMLVVSPEGLILLANDQAEALFGYDHAELSERAADQLLPASYRARRPFLQPGPQAFPLTQDLFGLRKDGQEFPMELRLKFVETQPEAIGLVTITDLTARRQAEARLQASESKYRSLVEAAFEGMWAVDTEGRTTFLNRRMVEMLKYDSPEALMAHSAFDFVPLEDREALRAEFRARLHHHPPERYDVRLQCRDGSLLWTSVTANNVLDDDGRVIGRMALFMDITERKKFETSLAQAGQMAHLGAWDVELQDLENLDVNPLHWSDEVYRIFGYAPGEVQPTNALFFERVHPEDRELIRTSLARAMATGQPYVQEHRVRRPDGEERVVQEHAEIFFDAAGRPNRIVGAVQDITERKQSEAESILQANLLAGVTDAIIATDLDLQIESWNTGAETLYGWAAQDVLGKPVAAVLGAEFLIAPSSKPASDEPAVRYWRGEVIHQRRDGTRLDVLSSVATYKDAAGRPAGYVALNRDITARKQAEAEIRALNLELEERVRRRTLELESANQELEAFAHSVSHDLRAPLRHITGYVDLLLKNAGTLDEKNAHYLAAVGQAARRMGLLIDDLLDFSRTSRVEMHTAPVDVETLVRQVISEFETEVAGRDVTWQIGALPPVQADRKLLELVFTNLISNALKFTSPRAQARIEIGSQPAAGRLRVLYVRDNGVGFDMQYADKLFGIFQRLHRTDEFEGTGVGLANVRRIIHRHGGHTWAEANLDQGATFFISLPAAEI